MLPAGHLRHVVAVEEDKGAKDANGQTIANWRVVLPVVRALVKGQTGREFIQAQQQQAQFTHWVYVRYQCKLADSKGRKLRLKWEGRTLNILSASDAIGNRRELLLVCVEDLKAD